MTTNIYWLTKDEAYAEMHSICRTIFGARNIWLSNDDILEQFRRIDAMFRNCEYYDDQKVRKLDETAEEIANLDF